MSKTMQEEINRILASISEGDGNEQEGTPLPQTEQPSQEPLIEYDVYVEAEQGRITFIKKEPPTVEATRPTPPHNADEQLLLSHRTSTFLACCTILWYLFLIGTRLCLQLSLLLNLPTAIIDLIPTSQTLPLSSTLQLGRVLQPVTLSQSQTVTTTGHGHQDAQRATGAITLFNGSLTGQTIAAGTELVGRDGVRIVTDHAASVPAASPPSEGQVTVAAHALQAGRMGNIQAGDLSVALSTDLLASNRTAFSGGQDERDFRIVAETDITSTAQPLQTAVTESMQAAFQGQLTTGEGFHMLPCTPNTTADHGIREEATRVTVTVTLTCSAVAYNEHTLRANVMTLLTAQARRTLGAGYTLLTMQMHVVHAASESPNCVLMVSSTGTFVYTLTSHQQERIKALVRGKSITTALQRLRSFPGIKSAIVSGIPATQKLPTDPSQIHLVIIAER